MPKIDLGVQTETQQAKKDLNDVVTAINGVKSAIDGLKSSTGLDKVKQSAKSAADEVKKTRPTFSEFKSALKGMDFPLKNFGKSLMRIAKLRLLRGIIRSITGAFKEGLSNIYQYSAAMNSMDASHMKNSMDSLASSLLYMKNAVASAVAPLIAQLVPVIAQVANWFAIAASAVAQFFAALGGATTFTRAKRESVEWGNVAAGAGGAAAAAQEYKNTILGFDEIHALNDVPSGGGGGGGGGGGTPDYSNMFEEAEISQKIKDLVQWLKDNWTEIWSIIRHIGEAMLAWRIGQSVIDFFNKLGLGGAANVAKIAMGLVISVIGIDLAFEGGYSAGYNGFNIVNILQTVLGYGLAAIGGAIAFGPAGAVITFGVAIIGSIIGFQIGQQEKMLDQTYRLTEGYFDFVSTMEIVNEILSHTGTVTGVAESAMKKYGDTIAKVKIAETLIPQIEMLSSHTERSTFENEKLKELIQQLNDLGLEGVTASYDEMTGAVELNTEAVYENLEAIKQNAKTEAYLDIMKAAWRDQAQAVLDNQIARDALTDADNHLAQAQKELLDYEKEYTGTLDYSKDKHDQLQQAVYDWQDAQNAASAAVKDTKDRMKEANKVAGETEKAFKEIAGEAKLTEAEINELKNSFVNLRNTKVDLYSVQQTFQNLGWSAYDSAQKAWNLKYALDNLNGMSVHFTVAAYTVANGVATAMSSMTELARRARGYADGGFVPGYAKGGFIPSYATGGINSAALFMARENGMPEMVGQIGGHTAVANNGQIVEAVSRGVANAVSAVMGSGANGNVEVNVTLDGQRIARAVDNANRVRNRRFNVQA